MLAFGGAVGISGPAEGGQAWTAFGGAVGISGPAEGGQAWTLSPLDVESSIASWYDGGPPTSLESIVDQLEYPAAP